jgi:2Fe-2S ferredoxin
MAPDITFQPSNKTIRVPSGCKVLVAAQRANIRIRTLCGGNASCLMCKVIATDDGGISPANDKEVRKLGDLLHRGFRLACQARVIRSASVTVPEDPFKAAVRAQLERQNNEDD